MKILNQESFLQSTKRRFAQLFNKKLQAASREVQKQVAVMIPKWIEETPEIEELKKKGRFWGELGVPEPMLDRAIEDIKSLAAKSINVSLTKKPFGIGGLSITIFQDRFAEFLSLPSGTYITKKGVDIPWLQSLLLDGSKIIVKDYGFREKDYTNSTTSRTKKGIMIKSPGEFWRVPPEFSGTVNDNFLSRAVQKHEKDILNMALEIIKEL